MNLAASEFLTPPTPWPAIYIIQSVQCLLLLGSGVGVLLTLLSSLPLNFNHFFVDSVRSRSSSALGSFRCMKLQNPPLTQPSPLLSRQQASLKSVTGDNSQYIGRPAYHLELSASHAACAESSYLNRAYTLLMRWSLLLSHTTTSS